MYIGIIRIKKYQLRKEKLRCFHKKQILREIMLAVIFGVNTEYIQF